jgi:Hemerythrin HHE cation binding domain
MTITQQGTIDFTEMYAVHNAFRRDLGRFLTAATAGKALGPRVQAGWANFKIQLGIHHSVEDAWLWPRLQRKLADRPAELVLLAEMEAEHARINPLLAAVDAALPGQGTNLVMHVEELSAVLGYHLRHEEDSALPLIQSVMTPAEWKGFRSAMTKAQGIKGAAVFIPWLVDGLPAADQHRPTANMPAPARLLNRLVWAPRYRKRNLWSFIEGSE